MATLPALVEHWNPLQGEQLKTAPKGFEKDHPGIEYLRYKQFLFMQNIDDDALFDSKFGPWIVEQFKAIKPFHNYMGDVLTSNLNGESIL